MFSNKSSVRKCLADVASYVLLGLAMLAVITATAGVMGILTFISTGGNWSEVLRVVTNIMFLGFTVIFTIIAFLVIFTRN